MGLRARALGGIAVVAAAFAATLAFSPREHAPAVSARSVPTALTASGTSAPVAAADHAPRATPPRGASAPVEVSPAGSAPSEPGDFTPSRALTDAPRKQLLATLDGADAPAKIDAMDELVRRRDATALPRLLAMDPAADPFLGPSILASIGKLGAHAGAADQKAAVARLAALLAEEKERRGADSAGNVLVILEALGDLATPDAARVLERELPDPAHTDAVRVVIVSSLEACGQRASVAVLAPYRASMPAPAGDALAREIAVELSRALDRAIATLERAG